MPFLPLSVKKMAHMLMSPALILALAVVFFGCTPEAANPYRTWRVYGGDLGGSRYSELDQINRSNVQQLEVVWTYHTGDKRDDPPSTIECNPIIVDGVMYVTSPVLKVIALQAATGAMIWTFDPFDGGRARGGQPRSYLLGGWRRPANTLHRRFQSLCSGC